MHTRKEQDTFERQCHASRDVIVRARVSVGTSAGARVPPDEAEVPLAAQGPLAPLHLYAAIATATEVDTYIIGCIAPGSMRIEPCFEQLRDDEGFGCVAKTDVTPHLTCRLSIDLEQCELNHVICPCRSNRARGHSRRRACEH